MFNDGRLMSKRNLWFAFFVFALGCGGGGTGPSDQIPAVAGDYSGTSTIEETGVPSQTCPATISVTQRNEVVVFTPLIERGPCGDRQVDQGEWKIDQTGTLNSRAPVTGVHPRCGAMTGSTRGGFSGRELRLITTASSSTCTFTRTAILFR